MKKISFAIIYNPYSDIEHIYEQSELATNEYIQDFKGQRCFLKLNSTKTIQELVENYSFISTNYASTTKDEHHRWVQTILNKIHTNEIEKCVAARIEVMPNSALEVVTSYHRLKSSLPSTFVFLYAIDGQFWLGASPELIGRTDHGIFRTISIAGTTIYDGTSFGTKEQNEQVIVTKFIENIVNPKDTVTEIVAPRVVSYGSLRHLVHDIAIRIDNTTFDNLIHQIHPSPAIVGSPRDAANQLIVNHEPISRELYTGMTKFESDTEQYAFAHIRCAMISLNQVVFYAGGGIVSGSDPESEYEETSSKIDIIKNIIYP